MRIEFEDTFTLTVEGHEIETDISGYFDLDPNGDFECIHQFQGFDLASRVKNFAEIERKHSPTLYATVAAQLRRNYADEIADKIAEYRSPAMRLANKYDRERKANL